MQKKKSLALKLWICWSFKVQPPTDDFPYSVKGNSAKVPRWAARNEPRHLSLNWLFQNLKIKPWKEWTNNSRDFANLFLLVGLLLYWNFCTSELFDIASYFIFQILVMISCTMCDYCSYKLISYSIWDIWGTVAIITLFGFRILPSSTPASSQA